MRSGGPVLVTGGSGFIGTAVIDELQSLGFAPVNVDVVPPRKPSQFDYWLKGDVLSQDFVTDVCERIRPRVCIHLAAETEMLDSVDIDADFRVNTHAAPILLNALTQVGCEHAVLASTQFVVGPDASPPDSPTFYAPHTAYGHSKVRMEESIRAARGTVAWTIVRPTYVWGPWHLGRFMELARAIQMRRYRHPSGPPVFRSYGYVKNVAWQLVNLMLKSEAYGETYYLGEPSRDSRGFVNALSAVLTHRPAATAPRWLLRSAAYVGDRSKLVPLDTFRFRNLTTDYVVSVHQIYDLLGAPPMSLDTAVEDFAAWLAEWDASAKTATD